MSATSKTRITLSAVGVLVVLLPLLTFAAACPVCGARTAKLATVADDTNAPSKNLCVWNRSICANLFYGPDSEICTRCWHAHSTTAGKWERASELPASFQRPLSSAIRGIPIPSTNDLRSRAVFAQTYTKKAFAESVAFWCTNSESVLTSLRGYCATNRLTLSVESNRLAGQVYVRIE